MIKLKPEYKIQRKVGKSNRWEMTHWADVPASLSSCLIDLDRANYYYPDKIFRIVKIYKSYEIVK